MNHRRANTVASALALALLAGCLLAGCAQPIAPSRNASAAGANRLAGSGAGVPMGPGVPSMPAWMARMQESTKAACGARMFDPSSQANVQTRYPDPPANPGVKQQKAMSKPSLSWFGRGR